MRRAALLALTILSALSAPGCGARQARLGEALFAERPDDGGTSIRRLQELLRDVTIQTGADVAVGVTDEGLVGLTLSGDSQWRYDHELSRRPDVAGLVVVGTGGGELFCLNAATGELLWKRPTGGLDLTGAGDDGDTTVVALEAPAGLGSIVLMVTRDGTVLRQLESHGRLGRPGVIAGVAFLPWMGHSVTAYNITSGEEAARAVFPTVTTSAFTLEHSLYFGEVSLRRFDETIGEPETAPSIELPPHPLVPSPRWTQRLDDRAPLLAGQPDEVRAYARPTPRGVPLSVEDGREYVTYRRFVVAMLGKATRPLWVHTQDHDLLAAAVYHGGVAVCDEAGHLSLLDETTGQAVTELHLGRPLRSCVLAADTFRRAPTADPGPPLADQIALALALDEPALVPAQRYLLAQLASLETGRVTELLLALCRDPRTPPPLLGDLRGFIATRRTGVEAMLAALSPEPPAALARRPAPRGALAQALAALGEARAAPPLALALLDPATPGADLPPIAAALERLATAREQGPLETFLALYRCSDDDDNLRSAVVSAARGVVRLGGAARVARAALDPLTHPALRPRLARLVPAAAPRAPDHSPGPPPGRQTPPAPATSR